MILPVVISDGPAFKNYQFTHNLDSFDCRQYVYQPGAFLTSPKHMELQDKMMVWIEKVANAIESVPPWQPQWLEIAETIANDFKPENPHIKLSKPQMIDYNKKWET